MKRLSLALLLASLFVAPAWAGPGHDHGDEAAPVTAGGPQRQPDGSVFLPKPAQRQIGVRTQPVAKAQLPRAFELQAQVIADPNAGGKVQATQAGRLVAPPEGLPGLGQRVQRGQLLAWVEPAAGSLERSGQLAQIAELQANLGVAEKRVQRLRELSDTVPRREIEAAEADWVGLQQRLQALRAGLSGREALRAPVGGVIASAQAVAGQVVDARELVFEIVDPKRLRVEALAYEPALAQDVGAAHLQAGGEALRFLGAAGALREQVLPLHFALQDSPQALAVGQMLRVVVQSRSRSEGFAVPAAALAKNPSNQSIVWVKASPERFVPKVVRVAPLDGRQVVVTQGLDDGDRVVTEGASLVNQIR